MHHSPDFYRDDIKNSFEEKVVGNSSILFYGHEHHNGYRRTSYDGSNTVIVQSGGCLCNNGNWDQSSYRVGILDTEAKTYKFHKFQWNDIAKRYEHNDIKTDLVEVCGTQLAIARDFLDSLYDEEFRKNYYVFPTIELHAKKPENTKQFNNFEGFLTELLKYNKAIITGTSSIGKSSLLKKLFERLSIDYFVLFCSPEILLNKSKNKKQNIEKLIKELFHDIYGDAESDWQAFEQCDKSKCIFIFDDFDYINGINISEFLKGLSVRFNTIILSSGQLIELDPSNILVNEDDKIAKFKIRPFVGNKRRQLLEAVVSQRADDKSPTSISNIVSQIDNIVKSIINLIPPEPGYLVQIAENFINSVGEAVNSNANVFSKMFEANITAKIDTAIKKYKSNITVDKMYLFLGRIAYYIHFNKAYPISRSAINDIIMQYNKDYGNTIITEDVIAIAKQSKILIVNQENSELYRFGNHSQLAYFIAKEIIDKYKDTQDKCDLESILNNCCINICTDVLLFIIYLSDDISILKNILTFINQTVNNNVKWNEFEIPNNVPAFLSGIKTENEEVNGINIIEAKKKLEQIEGKAEEMMLSEFNINDIYDWDDTVIEQISGQLIRMTSLLHIISKSLPCFEHKLKIDDKMQLVECLYRLPNMIFMFWANAVEEVYEELIGELKLLPYLSSENPKYFDEEKADKKARRDFFMSSINLLLNLYYMPVLNASAKNTYEFLTNSEVFDYKKKTTYILEHLMILEQITNDNTFVKRAIELDDEFNYGLLELMLHSVVYHGIITRNDKREDFDRLLQKFFSKTTKTPLLTEREKNRYLNE
jgi:GTP-binding protein EngB required for normal cell division